ncbi:fructose-bisphosphate aldolase class I [Candidatus Daviesbacteria bacterium]|nr:fructose-bisphosphate aldolase class I [Candidatus Daviesbacteria bacterium]
MNSNLSDTAKLLSSPPGVIVAADESPSTMKSRFDKVGIADSFEMRANWREVIAGAPIGKMGASGIILHPEMLEVSGVIEPLKKQNIVIIVKIDGGLEDFGTEGEQVTKFAENLEELLAKWKNLGAAATKFRSVFKISNSTPSEELIAKNSAVQAKLTKLSYDAGLVPMIEPEVLRTGDHSLEKDAEVTSKVLDAVFAEVLKVGIDYTKAILKPNMITPGEDSTEEVSVDQVAKATLDVLTNHVPKEIAGINFLSGGISDELSEQYLNRICQIAKEKGQENISGSFGRAIVGAPLKIWMGNDDNVEKAREVLVERVKRSSLARQGKL